MSAPRWAAARWTAALPGLVVFLVHTALLYRATMGHTGGEPTYPVDDAFIHLALAKHIAWDGVYGVTAREFTSASSSIAWPWLLAATLRVFGDSARAPFVLNVVIGACVPFAVDWSLCVLGEGAISKLRRVIVVLLVVIMTPLPTLAMIGMEHTLHVLATILFVTALAAFIADPKKSVRWPAALAFLLATARYEAAFLIAIACALLALRKRWRDAFTIGSAALLPVVTFGLFSKAHGSFFFPTSVLLKRRPFIFKDISDVGDAIGGDLFHRMAGEAHLLVLGGACVWIAQWSLRKRGAWTLRSLALILAMGGLFAHLELAGLGWFYRYDSYLVALLITVVGAVAGAEAPKTTRAEMKTAAYWVSVLGVLCIVGPLWRRAAEAAKYTPAAGGNIFEQQVQTAHFLSRYFPTDLAAVNDIGAVTYYREGPIVDLVGLADKRVAQAKKMQLNEPMSEADFVELTRGAPVAVIYDDWFKGLVPSSWFKVATFTIGNNHSCASATVSVYAAQTDAIGRVLDAAHDFSTRELARSVRTEGPATVGRAPGAIRSRDVIEIKVDGSDKLSGAFAVADDGTVEIEGVRAVVVRGEPEAFAEANLAAEIHDSPDAVKKGAGAVHVRVIRRAPARAYVAGRVARATVLDGNDVTLVDAINAADPLPDADVSRAYVWRDGPEGPHVIAREVAEAAPLVDNDIVVVPQK